MRFNCGFEVARDLRDGPNVYSAIRHYLFVRTVHSLAR